MLSLTLLISLYTLLASVGSSCPPDMLLNLFQCMEQLQPTKLDDGVIGDFGGDASTFEDIVPVLGNADPDIVEQQCREGKYHDAVECIDRNIQDCHESSLGKFKEIFDPTALRASIGYYCNNTATYRAASPCMKEHRFAMQHCVRQEMREMQRASVTRTTDVNEVCRLKMMGQECVNKILKAECGDEIADLVQKTGDAPLSQKCKAAKTGESFKVEYNPPPVKPKNEKNRKIRHRKNKRTTPATTRIQSTPFPSIATLDDGVRKVVLAVNNLQMPDKNKATKTSGFLCYFGAFIVTSIASIIS
ncbi:uncharacterized protein LOC141902387 [Tubulanus polymorphus]|uniref:uncharacterized protein LOC141902387 n=1 Tax=Tubulanus polymorphus TaxID=672921 RepID=UPI003DA6328E